MNGPTLKYIRQSINMTVTEIASVYQRSRSFWHRMEASLEPVPEGISDYFKIKAIGAGIDHTTIVVPTPQHLSLFRDHFKLTQAQAAALTGVSRVSWARWEKGRSSIPMHMIHTLRGMTQLLIPDSDQPNQPGG